jgi:hypothetical protein
MGSPYKIRRCPTLGPYGSPPSAFRLMSGARFEQELSEAVLPQRVVQLSECRVRNKYQQQDQARCEQLCQCTAERSERSRETLPMNEPNDRVLDKRKNK